MITTAKAAADYKPNQLFLVSERYIHLCVTPVPDWPIQYPFQQIIPDTLQKYLRLLVSHCAAFPE